MIPTLIDIFAAYLIVKQLRYWKNWLPVSIAAGIVIALAALFAMPPVGLNLRMALFAVLSHAAGCSLSAWVFAKFSRPSPRP